MSQPVVGRAAVERAAAAIEPWVRRTPVIELPPGTLGVDAPLVVKLELLQRTGSFKARGAFNRLLGGPVGPAGVITASGGNHGAAVADAARTLGHAVEVFVPATTAPFKRQRLVELGATVYEGGQSYADAAAACRARAEQTGALFVPAFDDVEVVAGQGTVARELDAQAAFDVLLVAVGGGGLVAGCLAWLGGGRPVRVVGVETEGTASMQRALAAGAPVDTELSGIAVDALGARRVGTVPFEIVRAAGAPVVLVRDDDVRAAQAALWRELRLVVEPAACAGLAALRAGAVKVERGERVALLLCGGNVDPATLAR